MPDALLQRIAAGDTAAAREVIDRYAGLVWSLARRFSYDASDAEDAVQEIFIDLWRSADRFDAAVASEPTFVAMIARRRLIDRRRKRARQPTLQRILESVDGPLPKSPDAAELGEEALRAVQALNELKPEQQRVLRLSVVHGLSHEKIAESTGIPLGTVKTHVRRGLMRVRELLSAAPSTWPTPPRSSDGERRVAP